MESIDQEHSRLFFPSRFFNFKPFHRPLKSLKTNLREIVCFHFLRLQTDHEQWCTQCAIKVQRPYKLCYMNMIYKSLLLSVKSMRLHNSKHESKEFIRSKILLLIIILII